MKMDLFEQSEGREAGESRGDGLAHDPSVLGPLASRMRPRRLEDIAGQDQILGPGKLLRRAIEADRLTSVILYGPPGCGKTTLAEVIALTTKKYFERTSGVLANVAILRQLLDAAVGRKKLRDEDTILFIDEIHRFNKAQQDILLPFVENGAITLIGATTHNPFFFINSPLTSRSRIFQLEPLKAEAVESILRKAIVEDHQLSSLNIRMDDGAIRFLAGVSEGDARRALGALEIAALTTAPGPDGAVSITLHEAQESIQKKAVVYDHDEDGHYDTISAFIKSVRGSDPDAAIYWLAKMLYAGEDPRFIARRLVILSSEDIGNADPRALSLAVSAMEAVDFVGMPEARIILAQATTYLATAPKSNASYVAVEEATEDIKQGRTLEVPLHLRDAGYKGAEQLGHGGYKYAHDYEGHVVDQTYIPEPRHYYRPATQGYEDTISKRLEHWNELRRQQRKQNP